MSYTLCCLNSTDMRVTGIVSAPLWDSNTSTYAGLLTVNDYLNVVRYYNLHADKLKDVDNLLLSDLRGNPSVKLEQNMANLSRGRASP
jgi:hypothetical protein